MADEKRTVDNARLTNSFDEAARPILAVDVEKYQEFLDAPGVGQEQKEEFLRAIWSIVVAFVDLGFSVHPLQEVCGNNENGAIIQAKSEFDSLESENVGEIDKANKSSLVHSLEAE